MKKLSLIFTLFASLFLLSSCGSKSVENRDNQNKALAKKSQVYPDRAYQAGEVPLHSFVQVSGEIQRTDQKNGKLEKGGRFILKTENIKIQILNTDYEGFKVGDKVKVYGQYYGFIRSMNIEKEN